MNSELVHIRVHHGNGFINYCDSGVDLSQFQYVDTTVSNPLHMRHVDMLGWIHTIGGPFLALFPLSKLKPFLLDDPPLAITTPAKFLLPLA